MEEQDKKIRSLLEEAERAFKEIIPILEKIGKLLVEKAKKETGIDLDYSIGWEEGGIECIALFPKKDGFPTRDDAFDWFEKSIQPLMDGLDIVYIDMPFSLSKTFKF